MQNLMVSEAKPANAGTSAAKVVSLHGEAPTFAEFDGMHLMLDGMRIYLRSQAGHPRLFLVPQDGGFALCLQANHGSRVWLIAERSKRVRIFKRIETALEVCRSLEANRVVVELDEPSPCSL